MESLKVRASTDAQESKMIRLPDDLNKRSSFHATVRQKNIEYIYFILFYSSYNRLFVRKI
jgi:hypothetical protein